MVFKCQEDSFLKEFSSTVVSCEKSNLNTVMNGKKTTLDGYEVILENSILFPEGGGQPADHGFLNDKEVLHVSRKGDQAVHFLKEPLDVGDNVKQLVDWKRRFDHMQQHSGQHLVSAILERDFRYTTVSWWLGEEVSYVELDVPAVSDEEIRRTEVVVNELIREGRKVTVQVFKEDTPEEDLKEARSARGLPEDHKGDIRVINIEGVEGNMCCGTHVSNLSQLQVIKMLHSEKSKRKNQTLVYFLVGDRVLKRFDAMLDREQKLTVVLNNGAVAHVGLVERLQKNSKVLNKNLQTVHKDLAILEVHKLKSILPTPKYYIYHRKEAEPDFMNVFIKELATTEIFLFLSTGDEKGVGNIVLYGTEEAIKELGNKICDLLEGKGAGKGNKFQAKVNCLNKKSQAEMLVKDYFS